MGNYVTTLRPTGLMILQTTAGKKVRVKRVSKYKDEVRAVDLATGLLLTLSKADLPGLPAH